MKRYTLLFAILSCLLISCKEETLKISTMNPNQSLGNGEWLDSSDTENGISIRQNKIAFFKKMVFNSDQIHQYRIMDSIYKEGKIEKKVGEYLIVEKASDTLIYRIVKRDKKAILLKDLKNNQKQYNLRRQKASR